MSNLNCPPRKKRSGATDSSTQPQASLSRSTPIRESSPIENVPSPSMSSILSSSNSSRPENNSIIKRKRSVNANKSVSLLQISKKNSEDDNSDFEGQSLTNRKKLRQFRNVGQNWRFIKPTNQNSLYFKILFKSEDVESLAINWCKDCTECYEKAIVELQQLFIDLTGVRNFDVECLLNKNYKQKDLVIETLEEAILETDLDKYYLCNSTHQYSITCLDEICKFIRHIWITSHEQQFLYEWKMLTDILKFLNLMAASTVKVIHHTGIFLAIKILSFVSEINKIIMDGSLRQQDKETNLRLLLKCEECLIHLLHKNCCNITNSPQRAKMQYLEETLIWFKRIPDVMFTEKYFNALLMLIEDPKNAKIRLKAVAISKNLVASPKFSQYITTVILKLVGTIEKRIWDIDYDVSVTAVNFFSLLVDNYPQYLTPKLQMGITKLIFQKNYPLARAAGQFTIKICRKRSDNSDDVDVINTLIQLLSFPSFAERIALLVESVIDFAKELQHYDLIFTLLMSGESTDEEEIILCKLLSQSVVQTITGKSPLVREKSRNEKPQELVNQKIVYFFITRLYDLMKKFSKNAICIKSFCEILLSFNYEETPLTHYNKYLDQLMSIQETLFIDNVNEDVLDSLSKLYSVWMADYSPFKVKACAVFDKVLEKTARHYKLNLEEYNEEKSELAISNLERDLVHLEVLFRYNDLRRVIDWNTLFISWDLNHEYFTIQSVEHNMKCCYWFLVWEARSLNDLNVTTDLLQQKVDQLELKCTNFMARCLSVMSENQEKPTLLQTAFDVTLDLPLQFLHELSAKFNTSQAFKQLLLKVSTVQGQNVLVDYVLTRAFTTTQRETLKMQRSNVSKLMNAFIEDIIPHEKYFAEVFQFYDEYHKSYGDIFDATLDMFQKLGGVALPCSLIVLTMRHSYIEYLSLKGNFDNTDPEVERINALGERFLQYLKRKIAEDTILGILKHAVFYSSSVLEHRHFLYFFHSFIPALEVNQHKELFNHLMKCMPEGGEDAPETFVNFAKKLNCRKGRKYQ